MLFRDSDEHMLAVNASVRTMVTDTETTEHAGKMAVAEEKISQKLKLVVQTTYTEDVVTEDTDHKIELASEEEHIYS